MNPTSSPAALLTRVDLNEQAYLALRRSVLNRVFGPGDQLNVRAISEELGVSRSPVLHAVTRLAAEGLVLSESRRGFYVKPLTVPEVRDAYNFRALLEQFAADTVIAEIGNGDLEKLRRLKEEVRVARGIDHDRYIAAHQDFHLYIVDLAASPLVSDSYRRLAALLTVVRTLADGDERDSPSSWTLSAHDEIVAAYEARDVENAKSALRADLDAGASRAIQIIEGAGGVL